MSYTTDTLASGGRAYFDGSFTVPTEVALPRIEYPFPEDTSTRQISRRLWVRSGSYSASSIATNTTDATFTAAVLTEERIVGEPGADLYEIERVYNEIPNPFREYETTVYSYPGLNQALLTTGTSITLTGVSYCHTTSSITWSSPTFPTLTNLRIQATFSTPVVTVAGRIYTGSRRNATIIEQITNPSGSGISYQQPLWSDQIAGTTVISTARAVTGGVNIARRNPFQDLVLSRVENDFIVVGSGSFASISSADSIAIAEPFRVVNAYTGQEQEYIAVNTNPSIAEYSAMVNESQFLATSDTAVDRWRGNIYRRRTRYVPAR
jgi:hypothetical protein